VTVSELLGVGDRPGRLEPQLTKGLDALQPAVTLRRNESEQRGRDDIVVKPYAQIVGIVVILIGVVGLVLGDQSLLGVLNIDIFEDIVHLVTGGLMAYVGFFSRDISLTKAVVGGLGVVYLLVGVLGFVVPELFGLLPSQYSVLDNLIHLTLGVLGVAVAWLVPGGARTA
jgi:hypothetical protein